MPLLFVGSLQGDASFSLALTLKDDDMRLLHEDAAVLAIMWPNQVTSQKRLTLYRQLSSLDLPEPDIQKWMEENKRELISHN